MFCQQIACGHSFVCTDSALITAVLVCLSAEAKFNQEIISGTSSYTSNKYVSMMQVVERNANCFSG